MAASGKAQRIFRFEELDSTNEQAKRMLAAGETGDFTVTAVRQTAGKGRSGRHWESPGGNLACTFAVVPEGSARPLSDLSFVAAVAVRETVAALLPADTPVRIKWPNDVLVNGAKISGILLEVVGAPTSPAVLVGIGINVSDAPAIEGRATAALAECGVEADTDAVLARLSEDFTRWRKCWAAEGLAPVRQAWLDHAVGLGQEIVVRIGNKAETGRFEALDANGALILRRGDGEARTVTAGDVFLV
jgi:BirA family biotin operon repressor/biotin-[acetyl-CoA-carboxylase] ligase